ncbi:MAG: HEAT repeat domain-containing protein [Planctomycetota bacterium]|jgi:hypothetical protein
MARDRGGRSSRRARSSRRDEIEEAQDVEEAQEIEEATPVSGRRSGRDRSRGKSRKKGKGKKKIDVMPIIMVGLLIAAAGGAAAYFPMQKRTLRQAVGGGGRLGFDAARELAKSPAEASVLCGIVESSPSGRMAAAAALTLMARRSEGAKVVANIQRRLKAGVTADAQAAYAAALAQSRTEAGEAAAALVVTNGTTEAKRAAVRGLANGTTAAAAQAVGRAVGDPDPEVRRLARDAVADWVVTAPKKAAQAASAALAADDEAAQVAAAEVMLAAARGIGPEQLLPLLSNDSAQVRELGLRAVMASGALQEGDGPLTAAVVKLVDVDNQPPGVKTAALDAVAATGLKAAGPGTLAILERDPDEEVRVKAARTIGVTRPEGSWEALVAPLIQDDAPRDLRIACVEALAQKGYVTPPAKLDLVAEALIKQAEGSDETLAGLALIALATVTNKRDVKYNAAQWRTYVARILFESRIYREAQELFKIKKKEYEEKKDDPDAVEAIAKDIFEAGWLLQNKVIPDAVYVDKDQLMNLRDAMKRYHDKIKKN